MQKKNSHVFNQKRFLLIILVCIGLFFINKFYAYADGIDKYKVKTVVIDPGHGGKDSGALGKHSMEKDVVLAIALKLGKYIEENFNDVNVIYTRTTDVFVPLYKRAEIANENDADLFISIHANGLANPAIYGTETLVLGLHRENENFEVAKRENSVILLEDDYSTRYEGFDPNSSESYIIFKLMQNIYDKQSIDFANDVQDQFQNRAKRLDRGVKRQGLLVLAQTSMPGVLVETGFITNKNEERFLTSEQGQDYIASAIYRAFKEYKHSVESKAILAQELAKPASNMVFKSDTVKIITPSATKTLSEKTPVPDAKNSDTVAKISTNDTISTAINNKGILFKVQITASSQVIPLNDDLFKDFNDVEVFHVGNIYKYAVGTEYSYSKVEEYSKWVKNRFPDAFIIALKNGQIIPLDEALKEINN